MRDASENLSDECVLKEIINDNPIEIAHSLGFTKLTKLHNEWIRSFVFGEEDQTLQSHRGSYKTTVLSLSMALIMVMFPEKRIIYFRKTDTDVKEVGRQVKNILLSRTFKQIVKTIYPKTRFYLTKDSDSEISTSLAKSSIFGASQLLGLGIGTSITGKHADIVITDDIVNVKDRASKAEREKTKIAYDELQNIKNRGGRFINTGTPWHKEDAFTKMPNIKRFDCYHTGLITADELGNLKSRMSPALFAANYELRHIASEDVIFGIPAFGADIELVKNGFGHVDAAYGGGDYTALSFMKKSGGKYYLYGKIWHKHIDDCYDKIKSEYDRLLCTKILDETNGDKGYVAKELKNRGMRVMPYHEQMNKYLKIATHLKGIWQDVVIVDGTDKEYIEQITDYTDTAEHDDAPDSAACLARFLAPKKENTGSHFLM